MDKFNFFNNLDLHNRIENRVPLLTMTLKGINCVIGNEFTRAFSNLISLIKVLRIPDFNKEPEIRKVEL